MAMNDSSKFKEMISSSDLIRSGSPAVYQLRPKKHGFGALTRMTVGERNAAKPNKTILLLGETGVGKSTLINALLNYSMGVKWEDEVWFQIIEEEKNQTESPTSDVIVYEIFGYEDEALPYSLTFIDTPGVGGPRGDVVIKRLFKLFQSEGGVGEVHAVGLVTKATGNRPSDRLMDIVYFLIARFGKGLEKNIMALVTHSDGRMPENVLKALEAAEMNFPRSEKNELVHFLFNNQQDKERTQRNEAGLKAAWSITETGMSQLGALMEKTGEVTKELIRLEVCISNLQKLVISTFEDQNKHDANTGNNEKLGVVKPTPQCKKATEIFKGKDNVTRCTYCQENCHISCEAWDPKGCKYMIAGKCTVCIKGCEPKHHVTDKWIYID